MMIDPEALFHTEDHVDLRAVRARTLLVTLTSFVDAGQAQQLIDRHLLDVFAHHKLGSFDVDELIDYRGQRPVLIFDADKFVEYQQPSMELHHMVDESSVPFLLLRGVEPDLRWEKLIRSIHWVIGQTSVERVVIVGAIPMPVPHTRPVTLTKHASKPDLIPGNQPLFSRMATGGAFPSLLEFRLGEAGVDVIGLTAHVPHYLAQSEFPDAAIALINAFSQATGHTIATTDLAIRAGITRAAIANEVENSEEASGLVHALEEQFDSFTEQVAATPPLTASHEDLPTGDDIAAEAEAFLRAQRDEGLE
ncbi:PAC2 family protein [Propionibacteriaceae bacterium Y1923]|uniref:PAC2 family protein n=1 Tax=Aestuariimicrobium sp. Y1814 TaxID=3418742 RepID=UPI003C2A07A0